LVPLAGDVFGEYIGCAFGDWVEFPADVGT
jgi:hypothetical protein